MGKEDGFAGKAAVFLTKFFAIYAVLQLLILFAPLGPLKEFIASVEAGLLGAEAYGSLVILGGHRFEIVANCTGLMGISVLAAIIFSLRQPETRKKLALVGAGTLVLFPLNIVRVYFVLLAATAFGAEIAEALHVVSWFGVSAAILLLWYYLTKRVSGKDSFAKML